MLKKLWKTISIRWHINILQIRLFLEITSLLTLIWPTTDANFAMRPNFKFFFHRLYSGSSLKIGNGNWKNKWEYEIELKQFGLQILNNEDCGKAYIWERYSVRSSFHESLLPADTFEKRWVICFLTLFYEGRIAIHFSPLSQDLAENIPRFPSQIPILPMRHPQIVFPKMWSYQLANFIAFCLNYEISRRHDSQQKQKCLKQSKLR